MTDILSAGTVQFRHDWYRPGGPGGRCPARTCRMQWVFFLMVAMVMFAPEMGRSLDISPTELELEEKNHRTIFFASQYGEW